MVGAVFILFADCIVKSIKHRLMCLGTFPYYFAPRLFPSSPPIQLLSYIFVAHLRSLLLLILTSILANDSSLHCFVIHLSELALL